MIKAAYITSILGKGACRLSIISYATLASISLFYVYTIASYLKVSIYPLEHRIVYYTFFDSYIINKDVDHIIIVTGTVLWLALSLKCKAKFIAPLLYGGIALLAAAANHHSVLLDVVALSSIPIIISFFLYDKFTSKKNNKQVLNIHANFLLRNYLAIIGIITGIIGFILSLSPLFAVTPNSTLVRNYPYDIFLFLSSFSPALILLLIACVPVSLFLKEFMSGILKFKNKKIHQLPSGGTSLKPRWIIFYLLLFMLISVAVALIPHQPTINRDNQQIGVDTDYYVKWVDMLMHSHDYREFLQQAFVTQSHGDRPLTLIFLFTIAKIVNVNLFYIIEYVPVILGPALVLAVYFLTRELTSNQTASLYASFLTAMSFQVLIGIYAGLYANWFALIIGFLSFVFLFRFLKRPDNNLNLVVFSTLIVLLLFSHVYTWSILVIVIGVFLAAMLKLNQYHKKSIVLLLLVVLASVIIDVARMSIIGSAGGIEKDIEFAKVTGAGPQQFALRWINLMRTMYSFVGGLFSNIIILTLGLYWLFRSNLREPSNIFLIIYLSAGLIPFLLGDYIIQTRVFYNIPFQIPAAIGLAFIRKQVIGVMLVLLICLWLFDITIMAVTNFYLIRPS
ncbi:MAG TPA: hypothetical protein VI278_07910 [Nitrososphaeraceae archaeon]